MEDYKYKNIKQFLTDVDHDTVFVEIGSERGDGSTLYLADLALENHVKLISVDVDDVLARHGQDQKINPKRFWRRFYNRIKDSAWPDASDSIDGLPDDIKQECIDIHGWRDQERYMLDHNAAVKESEPTTTYTLENHPALTLVQDRGSSWCEKYSVSSGKKISCLYLDNFDYIYEGMDCTRQIEEYQREFGLAMSNQNCQVEHFTQFLHLVDCLDQHCVVALDDTYQHNGCWIGKSGPVVVYLLAMGWEIVYNQHLFVILKRRDTV